MSESGPARGRVDQMLSTEKLSGARQPLAKASTLPADAFTSPEIYQREIERLLTREWLCAGRADQVPEPGDYFSLDLLGDRLVVVRGKDGEIRVLSRICRHRAAELVKGAGHTKSFQCPYHAWTYHLDGRLAGAPHMESVEDFDRAACQLPRLRSEVWEGWIFVNFDSDAEPLAAQLAPLAKIFANYRMSEMITVETATFDSKFNWKILVDNFMEAYHHIAIHRDTLEPLFPAAESWSPDNEGPYSVLVMPAREHGSNSVDGPTPSLPRAGNLSPDEEGRLIIASVFPFHLFAPGAESLTWYQVLPESFDRFTLRIYTCFPKQTLENASHHESVHGLQEFIKAIHHQDIEACEAVWAGLCTGSFESGRLSHLEKPIWQFNQWWIERMTAA